MVFRFVLVRKASLVFLWSLSAMSFLLLKAELSKRTLPEY
jgi:hypothetical protein